MSSLCFRSFPLFSLIGCHVKLLNRQSGLWINSAALPLCDKTSSKTRGARIIMLEWFSGSLQPYLHSSRTGQFGLRRETFDVNLAAPLEDKAPAFLTSWDNSVSAGQGSMALGLMDRQCPMGILGVSVLLGATEWELYNSCKCQWTAVFLFFAAVWEKSSGKLQLTCQNKFRYISKLAC